LKPEVKREAVRWLQVHYAVSECRGCKAVQMYRSTYRYTSKADNQNLLRMRIKDIASKRVRYGYKRIHILSKRESWQINHKHVYRLYREKELNLCFKTKRKRISGTSIPREDVQRVTECWAMDFVSDCLFDVNGGLNL
jgi:putative transposase